jgi:EAL domain-containing protein (putative c-di-GMP-specific phosphodiesterase class I)
MGRLPSYTQPPGLSDLSNPNQNAALLPESEAAGDSAAALGAQVLALLPTLRLHSVSLFDAKGDVQWLSEGALGPDEQSVVEESIAALSAAATRAHLEVSLADSRAALFLAVRTPRATLAGVVMVLMDAKSLNSGNLAARVLTTSMRSVLQKIAMLLVPPPPIAATGTLSSLSAIRTFSSGTLPLEVARVPGAGVGDTANAPVDDSVDWQPTPEPVSVTLRDSQALAILEPPAAGDSTPVNDVLAWTAPETDASAEICFDADPVASLPTTDEVAALPAVRAEPRAALGPALRLRELVRLRAGGRTRRYQVVPTAEQQRGDALATLNQLLAWLQQNSRILRGDPLSFTIAVSAQALGDAGLPAALGSALAAAPVEPGMIGFELRESACVTQRVLAEKFLAQCEQSHCFAVIDDFTFDTAVLDLLRSNAVRLLKVDTRLVASALRDKLAQARVIAIVQAAKVMGMHCSAKYVDSQPGRRWISAVGFDFNQSTATESLQRLST